MELAVIANGHAEIPCGIALVEEGRRLIQEARTIDDLRLIRDQAEAIRSYARQRDASIDTINAASEVKIRAERRIGEFSMTIPARPGRTPKDSGILDTMSKIPKQDVLARAGLNWKTAQRCEAIASLDEDAFEQKIAECKESDTQLTSAMFLRLAREPREPPEERPWKLIAAIGELRSALIEIASEWPEDKRYVMGHRLVEMGQELIDTGEITA